MYGFLAGDRPTLTELLPDLGHYLVGTFEILGAGPARRVSSRYPRVREAAFINALSATVWMAPPLTAEIVTRWIVDGAADTLAEANAAAPPSARHWPRSCWKASTIAPIP